MPRPTKYWYWQISPYKPSYYVFLTLHDMAFRGMSFRIATVVRVGNTWRSMNETDFGVEGKGKTRDAAVDDLLEQIGGLG
jgi:hypothetical protein